MIKDNGYRLPQIPVCEFTDQDYAEAQKVLKQCFEHNVDGYIVERILENDGPAIRYIALHQETVKRMWENRLPFEYNEVEDCVEAMAALVFRSTVLATDWKGRPYWEIERRFPFYVALNKDLMKTKPIRDVLKWDNSEILVDSVDYLDFLESWIDQTAAP